MNRLQELLGKTLTRGKDDAELDELDRLLTVYRRHAIGAWERVQIDGAEAWQVRLDCGHLMLCCEQPQPGIVRDPDGAEWSVPLSFVCHSCFDARAEA